MQPTNTKGEEGGSQKTGGARARSQAKELVCVDILVRIRKPDAGSGGAYAAPLSVDWPGRVSQTDTSTGIVLDLESRTLRSIPP